MRRVGDSPSDRSRKLRDPVHKDIHLGPRELRVIDTPELQRLRGIRQLGAAFYVYPGAQHSRFEHAVGTCWMAKRILSCIEQRGAAGLPDEEERAVCLAALVHDVTHIPFGHTFEDERKLLPRHDRSEARYAHFLEGGALGETLREDEAGRLALEIMRPGAEMPAGRRYLRQIVSGTICADLLDYLKRDNYYCGLSQEYDERVFHCFGLAGGQFVLRLHHRGVFRRDALSEVTNLLRIRYVLSERVYYHHAKIACGVMISKLIERALGTGMEEAELYPLTDDALPFYLQQRCGTDPAVRDLLAGLRARGLYKRCYMLSRGIGEERVRELVARQGGSVWVEEAMSGGARLVVELPESKRSAEGSEAPAGARVAPLVENPVPESSAD